MRNHKMLIISAVHAKKFHPVKGLQVLLINFSQIRKNLNYICAILFNQMKSDKEIWNDFRKGKNYALSHIYHQHVQSLFRYGRKFSSDDELIKDTIQDLFFDLIRTRENLGETDNICFYLMRSFRRKLAKNLKNNFPLDFSEDFDLTPEIIYSAEHDFIQKE